MSDYSFFMLADETTDDQAVGSVIMTESFYSAPLNQAFNHVDILFNQLKQRLHIVLVPFDEVSIAQPFLSSRSYRRA